MRYPGLAVYLLIWASACSQSNDRLELLNHQFKLDPGDSLDHAFAVYGDARSWLEISIEPTSGTSSVALFREKERIAAFSRERVTEKTFFSGHVQADVYRLVVRNVSQDRPAEARIVIVRDYSR